jgi:hypothetical protein
MVEHASIPNTQEAEIRRIAVQNHLREKVSEMPTQPTSQMW